MSPMPLGASIALGQADTRVFSMRSVVYPPLLSSSSSSSSPANPPPAVEEPEEASSSMPDQPFLTARFQHAASSDGATWVLTAREGRLERCEDEVSSWRVAY